MRQTLTDDFWGLHKNMNCAFPLIHNHHWSMSDLGLFVSYLCDQFFIFSLIFIAINHTTSLKQTHLFFARFLEYLLLSLDDNVAEERQ